VVEKLKNIFVYSSRKILLDFVVEKSHKSLTPSDTRRPKPIAPKSPPLWACFDDFMGKVIAGATVFLGL
jgi:hypothetical protein